VPKPGRRHLESLVASKGLQVDLELLGGGVTLLAIAGQTPQHDRLESLGISLDELGWRAHRGPRHIVHDRVLALAAKKSLAGGQLVKHDAQGKNIAAAVERLARALRE
jgi:hypothetical protein